MLLDSKPNQANVAQLLSKPYATPGQEASYLKRLWASEQNIRQHEACSRLQSDARARDSKDPNRHTSEMRADNIIQYTETCHACTREVCLFNGSHRFGHLTLVARRFKVILMICQSKPSFQLYQAHESRETPRRAFVLSKSTDSTHSEIYTFKSLTDMKRKGKT